MASKQPERKKGAQAAGGNNPRRNGGPPSGAPAGAGEAAATWEPLASLKPWPKNPRKNDPAVPRVVQSLIRFGWGRPLVAQAATRELIVGHTARKAALALPEAWERADANERERWHEEARRTVDTGLVPVRFKTLPEAEAHALATADNRLNEFAQWDERELLAQLKAMDDGLQVVVGFDDAEMRVLARAVAGLEFEAGGGGANGSLAEDYGEPPFSVLDTRSGRWQDRRRAWLGLGIASEIGRGENLLNYSSQMLEASGRRKNRAKEPQRAGLTFGAIDGRSGAATGTSVFDPVLCELAISWWSPVGGLVVDPFAGGSVRGIVAAALGRSYRGHELRGEQVLANREQWKTIRPKLKKDAPQPEWIEGESQGTLKGRKAGEADFVFSCPPYMDLERYSDDPRDLSTLEPAAFAKAYQQIIREAVRVLRDDRFACFVVSEVRGPSPGYYRGLVPMTIAAFEAAGAHFYNEIVLVNSASSLPLRVRKQFEATRKVGRTHQNVLVFVKGNPEKATKACGKVDRVLWTDQPLEDAAAAVGATPL